LNSAFIHTSGNHFVKYSQQFKKRLGEKIKKQAIKAKSGLFKNIPQGTNKTGKVTEHGGCRALEKRGD